MITGIQKYKITITALLLTVVALGFVCFSMPVHAEGHAVSGAAGLVVNDNHEGCCDKGIAAMAASSERTSWFLPFNARGGLFALVLALLVLFITGRFKFWDSGGDRCLPWRRLYLRHNPDFLFFNYFRHAFARGLLHGKIY